MDWFRRRRISGAPEKGAGGSPVGPPRGDEKGSELQDQIWKIAIAEEGERHADVVFIHGLDGDLRTTWKAEASGELYFPSLLGEDLPGAAVSSIGYGVSSSAWRGHTMPLVDRALNILAILDANGFGSRPIVFVAHSFGGLLVKQMLRHSISYGNAAWLKIAQQTKGVAFLSTPHAGSGLATWLKHIRPLLPTVSIQELEAHQSNLRDLNLWYRNAVSDGTLKIEHLVLYEKRLTNGLLVVNPTSADPGIPGVTPIPLDSDHMSISKPISKFAPQYLLVRGFVARLLSVDAVVLTDESVSSVRSTPVDPQSDLLSYLQPLDFRDDLSCHLAHFVGRAWVFQQIDQWLATPRGSRVFWITGEAGVGKTALAAWLRANRPEISAFHLCQFGNSLTTDAGGAIRSLAYQLSTHLPDYRDRLDGGNLEFVRAETNPRALFQRLFITALQGLSSVGPVVILVDALDEATEHGRNGLAEVISSDFVKTPEWLRLVVTSRPHERELNFALQALDPWILRAQSPENIADLCAFLCAKLPGIEPQAIEEVIARSEGLFLYVDMVCGEIQAGRLSLDRTHEFPQGLGGFYAQSFRRYFGDKEAFRSRCRPALELICAAREPLTIDDLAGVLAWSAYDKNEIPAALGSLFPVSEGRIRPFHQSLRDWLNTDKLSGDYFVHAGEGERRLADYGYSQYRKGVGGMARYFLLHLPPHLSSTGRKEDLRKLLLDSSWILAKLDVTVVGSVIADYAYMDDYEPARLIREAIQLSANIIAKDLSQFSSQMTGRLLPYKSMPELAQFLQSLTDAIQEPWLRPLHPALLSPGTGLLRILEDHWNYVSAVAVSPDGRRALSGSYDTTLKLWDLETGGVVQTMRGHSNSITSVALFQNGRRAVSASDDRTLKVWDLETGHELWTLRGHSKGVEGVAVSPDGQLAVSASYDHTLRVWDLESGRQLRIIEGHLDGLRCVAFTPDGQMVLSGSDDATLKLWDLVTGRELRRLSGHSGGVHAVAVSPSGKRCVSGSGDSRVMIWDLETGRPLTALEGHTSDVTGVAVTSDGRRVVSASRDGTVKLWDLETAQIVRTLKGHSGEILGVAVTSDGRRAISASYDRTLKVWDLQTGSDLRSGGGHLHGVNSVTVTSDGRLAVSASYDTSLKLWDMETGQVVGTLQGHLRDVSCVAATPDGRRAISASWDGTLKIWDLETTRELMSLDGHGRGVTSVAVSPDGQRALSASDDFTVRLWDLETGRTLSVLSTRKANWSFRFAAFFPDGLSAILGSGGGAALWDLVEGDLYHVIKIAARTTDILVVTPDGSRFIAADQSSLYVYSRETGHLLRKLEGHSHGQVRYLHAIQSLAISQDGRRVLSSTRNGVITVWDLETGTPIAAFTVDAAAQCCVFASPSLVVAGDALGRVHFLALEFPGQGNST